MPVLFRKQTEIIRAGDVPIYDYMRSDDAPVSWRSWRLQSWLQKSEPENLDSLRAMLACDDSAIRYWGIQGLLLLGENASPALNRDWEAAFDESLERECDWERKSSTAGHESQSH